MDKFVNGLLATLIVIGAILLSLANAGIVLIIAMLRGLWHH